MHGFIVTDILKYLTYKLTICDKDIKKYTAELVQSANNLNFESIQRCTERLKIVQEKKREYTADFVKHNSVVDVIANLALLDKWTLENLYTYEIGVTVEEVKLLKATNEFYSLKPKILY